MITRFLRPMARLRLGFPALAAVLLAAVPVSGQSLYNAAGLGVPVEALDGRARALGSLGIGLRGSTAT